MVPFHCTLYPLWYTILHPYVYSVISILFLPLARFKDPTLWVAETTQKRVVEFQGRRFSWAIPSYPPTQVS